LLGVTSPRGLTEPSNLTLVDASNIASFGASPCTNDVFTPAVVAFSTSQRTRANSSQLWDSFEMRANTFNRGQVQLYSTVLQPYSTVLQPYSTVLQPYSTVLQPYSTVLHPYSTLLQLYIRDMSTSFSSPLPSFRCLCPSLWCTIIVMTIVCRCGLCVTCHRIPMGCVGRTLSRGI
jgi:hypothetical protein